MLWTAGLTLVLLAWCYHAFLILATWENRRFARTRIQNILPGVVPWQQVALVVPCKGAEPSLAENLRCFLQQDHPNYEVTFVVESRDDPAHQIIQNLLSDETRVAGQLLVAGRAWDTGQKTHNLRHAIDQLSDDVNVLAFADSDIRPKPDWLRALVGSLERKKCHGAVTGYRWFIPERNTLANLLLYSFNSSAAALFGPGGHFLVWGGSWAIRRDLFEQISVADAWQGTLSDDLVVSRALRLAELPIAFEPRSMVASHVDTNLRELAEFVRRQFLIGRHYANRTWLLCFAALTTCLLALWGSLGIAGWYLLSGQGMAWWWLANAAGMYSASVIRVALRQDMVRTYLPEKGSDLKVARQFDIWLSPLCGLLLWLGFVSSCAGHVITWRDISYFIAPGGRILFLGRRPTAPQQVNSAAHQVNSAARHGQLEIRKAA